MDMKTLREKIILILQKHFNAGLHYPMEPVDDMADADAILLAIKDALPLPKKLKDVHKLNDYNEWERVGWNAYRNEVVKRIRDSPHRKEEV